MGISAVKVNYETTQQNSAQILASGVLTFLSTEADKAQTSQWGSFSYLEVINDSGVEIKIDLDGLTTRRRTLFGKSVLIIKTEEGLFFNNVKITNADGATAVAANEITVSARIGRVVG